MVGKKSKDCVFVVKSKLKFFPEISKRIIFFINWKSKLIKKNLLYVHGCQHHLIYHCMPVILCYNFFKCLWLIDIKWFICSASNGSPGPINQFKSPPHICNCPMSGPGCPRSLYVVVFLCSLIWSHRWLFVCWYL